MVLKTGAYPWPPILAEYLMMISPTTCVARVETILLNIAANTELKANSGMFMPYWDVYALESKLVKLFEDDGLYPLMGYPQYLMLAKDGSDLVMLISDEKLEITDAVDEQLEQLRKEGHKRRPEQLWV